MTKLTFFVLALFFTIQSQAHELTPAEFTKAFVAQVHAQVKSKNAELRKEYQAKNREYPKYYCNPLNQKQIDLIEKTASTPDIRVGEFREAVLVDLKCFEERWPGLKKTNIWDTILNSSALIMDSYLLHDSIKALGSGRYVNDNERLLSFPNR